MIYDLLYRCMRGARAQYPKAVLLLAAGDVRLASHRFKDERRLVPTLRSLGRYGRPLKLREVDLSRHGVQESNSLGRISALAYGMLYHYVRHSQAWHAISHLRVQTNSNGRHHSSRTLQQTGFA